MNFYSTLNSYMSYLPKQFALRYSDGFKIYSSCVYKKQNGQDINILSRLDNYSVLLSAVVASPKTIYSSITRKWYGGDPVMVNWSCEGSEVKLAHTTLNNVLYIPVIIFIKCTHAILPSGINIHIPCSSIVEQKHTIYAYEQPDIHYTDPFHATESSVCVNPGLPTHVKHIILEHYIKNGESCAISGDTLEYASATVTSCGHVFDKASISRWLNSSDSNKSCPICKQVCTI